MTWRQGSILVVPYTYEARVACFARLDLPISVLGATPYFLHTTMYRVPGPQEAFMK